MPQDQCQIPAGRSILEEAAARGSLPQGTVYAQLAALRAKVDEQDRIIATLAEWGRAMVEFQQLTNAALKRIESRLGPIAPEIPEA